MKILYYECFSGISGDMNLGAMIDLGVDADYLRNELEKLGLDGWRLDIDKDQRHGITGTKATVVMTREEHVHRHLSDIENIISKSTLDPAVKETALNIFIKVAEAEAKVHNIDINKVHFHEVGAVDSIIDIAGAAICYEKLGIDRVISSPVELGGGFVKCAHGTLPVPAPATAEIVKDIPVSKDRVNFEATTPTGAAIIKTLASEFGKKIDMTILKTGYGVGQKDNDSLPNLLRVYIGQPAEEKAEGHKAFIIETNIDDMNPEMYENLTAKLFEKGAADVYLTPITMKRSRPATKISILCKESDIENIKEVLYLESTTLGLRIFTVDKHTLKRKTGSIETEFGRIRVKYAWHNDVPVSAKPEISDCIAAARKNNLPLTEVYNSIIAAIYENKG